MANLKVNDDIFTLNDGSKIRAVGLGTWQSVKGDAYDSVKIALANGYRHIDTAAIYKNEEEVGQAIKDSGIPRKDLYITTKLWNTDHKDAAAALDLSLKKLQLDYVDLYLIHWPVTLVDGGKFADDWNYVDTYKEVEKLLETGKVKSIGVSNFTKKKIATLLTNPDIKIRPAVNQIEAHPLLPQEDLTEFLKENNILIEAYSPLGSSNSPLFKNETIVAIAKKNDVEPAQVLISWAIQRGTVVLPKSVTESRIISNLKTFTLSDEDFATLNNLSEKDGVTRTCNPTWNVFADGE